jgi:hypothetical protein
MRCRRTKPACIVRRRSMVRFRNGTPAKTVRFEKQDRGTEGRWGLTAARRRHWQPASASPARPCRQLPGRPGQPRQILAVAVKAQVTAAPVSCPPGGPGRGSRAIVRCRARSRIPRADHARPATRRRREGPGDGRTYRSPVQTRAGLTSGTATRTYPPGCPEEGVDYCRGPDLHS